MAFTGVGGSANLGSATGFLFINSTGVKKGLDDASKAINKFDQASAKSAAATASLSDANAKLLATQSELRSATADHVSNLGLQAAAQSKLTAAQADYNNKAARTQSIQDSLVTSRNQIIDANDKLAKNAIRVTTAEKALAAAQADAISRGTATQTNAKALATKRLADTKAAQQLARSQLLLARNNVPVQREELVRLKKTGAPKADIANQVQVLKDARAELKLLDREYKESSSRVASAQREAVRATKELAAAQKTALAATNKAAIREHERAIAERDRLVAQKAAATHARDNDRINLTSAQHNEQLAKKALDSAKSEADVANAAVAASQKRVEASGRAAAAARKDYDQISAAAKKASKDQIDAANAATKQVLNSYAKIAAAIGGGLVLGLAAATKEFASFDEEMANVAAISPSLNQNFESLKEEVLDLSVALGKSPQDIAAGLFTVAQAGITDAEDAIALTKLAAQAAVAGRTTVEEATKPLIGLMNAYGLSAEEAAKSLDVLFQAAQDGVFDFKDLSSQLGDNLAIASQLNVPVTDLAAAYVVLTKRSNSLAESTTQVNGIMNSFLKPSDALSEAVQRYTKQTAEAFFRTHDFADVLSLVNQMFKDNADAAGKLFPNLRAIRGIYGLTGDEAKAYREEVKKLEAEQVKGGATAAVLARQQESAAFQFRQSREELRRAVILIGQSAAPAFLSLAKGAGAAASAFSDMDPVLRGTIIQFVQFGAFGLVATAGIARIASALIGLKTNLVSAATAILNFVRGMKTMTGALNAITGTLAIAGVALVVAALVGAEQQTKQNTKAFNDLEDAIKAVGEAAGELELEGFVRQANDLRRVESAFGGIRDTLQEVIDLQDEKKSSSLIESIKGTAVGSKNWVVNTLGGDSHTAADDAAKDMVRIDEELTKLRSIMANPNVDTTRFGEEIIKLFDILQTDPNASVDTFVAGVEDLITRIAEFPRTAEQAKQDAEDLANTYAGVGDEISESLSSAEERAAAFADAIKAAGDVALGAQSKIGDLTDPLASLQALLHSTGESAFATYLKLQKLGFVKFNAPEREALRLADGVAKAEAKINSINASIQNNSEDMAMWQENIDFVDDTLGDHTDTMKDYLGQLERGEITQEEFNDAVTSGDAHREFEELTKLYKEGAIDCATYNRALEAGRFIIERSTGGLKDERVEQVKNVIALADAIKARDRANKQYKELTSSQRAFLGGLADTSVQIALQTAALFAMLEAIGAVPEGTTTKFLADASQANPILASVLDDIDVFEGTHTSKMELDNAEGVISQLTEIKGVKERATSESSLKVTINGKDADKKLQEYINLNGDKLAESGIDVTFSINGKTYGPDDPKNPINEYLARNAEVGDGTSEASLNIHVDGVHDVQGAADAMNRAADAADRIAAQDASSSIVVTGAGAAQKQLDDTKKDAEEIPPTVTVTVETTGDLTKLSEIKTAVDTFAEDVKVSGALAGTNYLSGVNSGIDSGSPVFVQNLKTQMTNAFNLGLTDIFNDGWYAGRFYDAGVISGIASRSGDVYTAVHNLGVGMHNSMMNAIHAASPSKLAMEAGFSYVDGVVLALRSGAASAASEAQSLAKITSDSFQRQFALGDTAAFHTSAIADQQQGFARNANAALSLQRQVSGNTFTVSPSITVNGGETNEETAEVIWRRLEDGLIQFAAQTGVQS